MSATPETDKAERMAFGQEYMVPSDFARKLERERDEAIAARKASAADWLNQVEQANARVSRALQQVALAERGRDEAREKYDALATEHLLATNKLAGERDEAREVLKEIASATGFDNIGNWARNTARKALEAAE